MRWLWTAIMACSSALSPNSSMPGKDPGGIIITMLLGIAGSFLASWLGRDVGWYQEGQPAGFIASIIGAIILLANYRMFKRSPA